MRRAVFLDRDGVLNRPIIREGRPFAPTSLEEFEILPDVPQAIQRLKQAQFLLVVVTNQPDVGHGKISRDIVEKMNALIQNQFMIDDIQVDYSKQEEQSPRRKPRPGMLLDAAKSLKINLPESFMVGDRWSDIEAGKAAGCRTILIQNNYQEKQAANPDWTAKSLSEASEIILNAVPTHSAKN